MITSMSDDEAIYMGKSEQDFIRDYNVRKQIMKSRTMRTGAEMTLVLKTILQHYETFRTVLKMDKHKASKKVIEMYDDFRDWCYYQGDFENDKEHKAKN